MMHDCDVIYSKEHLKKTCSHRMNMLTSSMLIAKPGHGTKVRQKWSSSYPFCLAFVHIRSLQVEVVHEKVVCDTHAHMIKVILHDYICYMQLTSRNTD